MKKFLLFLAAFCLLTPSAFAGNGARVYHSINQVIPSGTTTVLTFNSERWDDNSYHDSSINPSRITLTTPGRYHVMANLCWNGPYYKISTIHFRVNGTQLIGRDQREIDPGNSCYTLSTIWSFAAGDYVEIIVSQSSGVNQLVWYGPAYTPEFGVELIP